MSPNPSSPNPSSSNSAPPNPPHCAHCGQWLSADVSACSACGQAAAYDPRAGLFRTLDTQGRWVDEAGAEVPSHLCDNARYGVCNWLFTPEAGRIYCDACRHNRTIPDLSIAGNLDRWARIEAAKRRCILTLIRLGVPPETNPPAAFGLFFDFLYDPAAEQGGTPSLTTGHQAGFVTLNLIEADDVARERIRRDFGEPYRTLVGHFRHEIGHYYWERLVQGSPDLMPFRRLFGDEQQDYGQAMSSYYGKADTAEWENDYVSRYATMHPWEDFAETFAHYLHIVDTLATMASFGLAIDAPRAAQGEARLAIGFDPFTADTATLIGAWIPLAFASNAINRSMGQPDLYPFRVTPQIVLKLDFVNRLLAFAAGRWAPGDREGAPLKAMIATLGRGVDLHD